MKAHRSVLRIVFVVAWCLVFLPFTIYAESVKEYIKISKAGVDRIPLVLKPIDTEKSKNKQYAAGIDAIIKRGLDFTGLFAIIKSPLNIVAGGDLYQAGKRQINFAALSSVGAEVYAGGVLERKGKNLSIDMEVYDALTGKLLMRKLYMGDRDDLRPIAHDFCADLVTLFTGKPSIFGSKIAFVSIYGDKKEIHLADFDGYGTARVANSGGLVLTSALSPDGSKLAYLTYARGRPDLHIKDLSTQKIVAITKKGVKIDPAWRNGSLELATTFSFDGNQELYLLRNNGSIVRRLTRHSMIDVSPSFSPDGSKMAFVSSRHGNPQIFIKDLNSGAVTRLTFQGKYNTQLRLPPFQENFLSPQHAFHQAPYYTHTFPFRHSDPLSLPKRSDSPPANWHCFSTGLPPLGRVLHYQTRKIHPSPFFGPLQEALPVQPKRHIPEPYPQHVQSRSTSMHILLQKQQQ